MQLWDLIHSSTQAAFGSKVVKRLEEYGSALVELRCVHNDLAEHPQNDSLDMRLDIQATRKELAMAANEHFGNDTSPERKRRRDEYSTFGVAVVGQ